MSAVLGQGVKKWVLQFLIWLVAITFVGSAFMVWGMKESQQEETVASIGEEVITRRQFAQERKQIEENLRKQLGGQVDAATLQSLNTPMMAINSIIARNLQANAAREAGLAVSKEEVKDAIMGMKDFQVNGAFDGNRYLDLLKKNGITPASFEEGLQSDILQQKMVALVERVALMPDIEARNYYLFENQPVAVDYVKLNSVDFEKNVTVSDDDLKKWFEGRKGDFREPESRVFRLLLLTPQALEQKVTLTDAEISEYYSGHSAEFGEKDEIHARHILVSLPLNSSQQEIAAAGEKIKKAAERIKAGEDFGKVAQEMSGDTASAKNGGDLGTFKRGTMAPEFDKAVFGLMEGEISQPFSTQFGLHIAQVISKKPGRVPPLDEVKQKVEASARRDKAKKEAYALMQSVASSVKPEAFAAVTDAHPEIKINTYTAAKNVTLANLGDSKKVTDLVFGLNERTVSGLIDLPEGYALAIVDNVRPPITPLFETIKQKVETAYKAEKAAKLAEEESLRMEKTAKAGKPLGLVAKESGYAVTRTPPFSRSNMASARQSGVEGMTTEAFTLSEGEVRGAPAQNGFVIMALAEKPPVDEKAMSEKMPEFSRKLLREKRARVFSEFLTNLRKKAEEKGQVKIIASMNK
ncbi:MAG: SurA N-terminal domain-containing protein [Nitrospinae bacterium]|nr:SurA N-terminal domain-containing protein [Nitrospinota bacterium]MBF0634140.1 SurA N-terminal domain-containing protein [Nitrospinota bacterium]